MQPSRRIIATIALTIPLSIIEIRGMLRVDNIPPPLMLVGAAIIAITIYRLWPALEIGWEDRHRPRLTWQRVIGAAAVVLLLTTAFALGGTWYGLDIDPWLVLAGLALTAMVTWFCWQDATIRVRATE